MVLVSALDGYTLGYKEANVYCIVLFTFFMRKSLSGEKLNIVTKMPILVDLAGLGLIAGK